MHCVVIAIFLLTMVNLSVSLHVSQRPRFLGLKTQHSVPIYCEMLDQKGNAAVKWFWSPEDFTESKTALGPSEHFKMSHNGEIKNGVLTIMNVQPEDSGVYYCQLNVSWGPGTQLQVFRRVNTAEAVRRSNLKDAMILIQGLLLGAIIVPVLLHLKEAKEKEDAIYEEPEDDHTYEGLEIEHCGLYEDIPALCEPSEAAWEKTETPLEE